MGSKLQVSNITTATSVDVLEKAFEKYGTIIEAYKTRKDIGFIAFSSPEEAGAAVAAMDGTNLGGRRIHCLKKYHKPRASTMRGAYDDPAAKLGRKVDIHNMFEVDLFPVKIFLFPVIPRVPDLKISKKLSGSLAR